MVNVEKEERPLVQKMKTSNGPWTLDTSTAISRAWQKGPMVAAPASFFVIRTSDQHERTTKKWTTRLWVMMSVVICYTTKTEERQEKEMDPERNGTGQLNLKIFKVDRCQIV
ncbi:hypothetical protein M513_14311 [Trichuris suis]|uniref:Uncharacterized protein n=1 Tax=Trichuris suis TaxID=68888 RepID=A0A085LIL6_9BILA|nr:hypothetical protein M513_14311 [Trichuris suis]